ncbi:MAG: hypothetical protein H6727_18375 [Myxococcales bacterium]|nr:hypothetical protein [Myxococcales bacterium]
MSKAVEVIIDGESYLHEGSVLFTRWCDDAEVNYTSLDVERLRHRESGAVVFLEGDFDRVNDLVLYREAKHSYTPQEIDWKPLFDTHGLSEQSIPGAEIGQDVEILHGTIDPRESQEPMDGPFVGASYVMWIGEVLYYGSDLFFSRERVLDSKSVSAFSRQRESFKRVSLPPWSRWLDFGLLFLFLGFALASALSLSWAVPWSFQSWFWWGGLTLSLVSMFGRFSYIPVTSGVIGCGLGLFLCTTWVHPLFRWEMGSQAVLWHMSICLFVLVTLFFLWDRGFAWVSSAARWAMLVYLSIGASIVQFTRPDEGESWTEAIAVLWRWPWSFLLLGLFLYTLWSRYKEGYLGMPTKIDDFVRMLRAFSSSLRTDGLDRDVRTLMLQAEQLQLALEYSSDARMGSIYRIWSSLADLKDVLAAVHLIDGNIRKDPTFRADLQVLYSDLEELEMSLFSEKGDVAGIRIPRALDLAVRKGKHTLLRDEDVP